jgi:hypothetical protein
MSGSALEAIYASLTKMSLAGIKCRGLAEVKLEVNERDLPIRMLLPNTTGETGFVGVGTLQEMVWQVTDVCLWDLLSAGGLEKMADPMVRYMVGYLKALKALRNPTTQSEIQGVGFELGPQLWADGQYWAIRMNLAIKEWF